MEKLSGQYLEKKKNNSCWLLVDVYSVTSCLCVDVNWENKSLIIRIGVKSVYV